MIQVRLPSGRVVSVNTDDPKIAGATARAFVLKDPYESKRADLSKDPSAKNTYGGLATFERAIPFLTEVGAGLGAGVDTAGDLLTGKGFHPGQNYAKQRAVQQADVDAFRTDHPVASGLTSVAGNAAPIAAAILSGGATAAPQIAEAAPEAANGIAGFLKPILMRAAQRATAGAGAGYVYGASQPGSLADRGKSATTGAATGAVVGTVLPPALQAAGSVAAKVGGKIATTATRAANRMTGGAILDASQTAAQRLVESLKADGATPEAIRTALNGFLKNGATDPSLIDVASRLPSGGANTLALVRAAAAKGSGRGVATTYADQVTADLQDKALAHTQKLTPLESRPANVVRDKAVAKHQTLADQEYQVPYDEAIDARPVIPALEGSTGRKALNVAYDTADARRQIEEMQQLAKIREAANPPEATPTPTATVGGDPVHSPSLEAKIRAALGLDVAADPNAPVPVRLGTLDRTKVALNDIGGDVAEKYPAKAAGYFDRAKEIDNHLADNSSAYATARDNYATRSAQIEALDHGATGVTALPDEYAANLHDFLSKGGPDAGKMAAVGYRQAIADRLGAPAEGSTGAINRTSTSTNQGRNLEETFGPEMAEHYRAGLKDLTTQLQNARSINPGTGSPTAQRLADMGLVEGSDVHPPSLSPWRWAWSALNKMRSGATLTDEERQIIAKMGTATADPNALNLDAGRALPPPEGMAELEAMALGQTAGQRRNSQ